MKKRLAVVAGGWHFPLHFYEAIAKQRVPDGWEVELYCVSHRDPKYSKEEKQEVLAKLGWSYRELFDRILYQDFATPEKLRALGWHYKEYPNTIGDWGMTNQWLDERDYKQYDMFLTSHDDNIILNDRLYLDLLDTGGDWLVTTNSAGSEPLSLRDRIAKWRTVPVNIRGSFEFVKPELLTMLGGKFDLSETSVTREGQVYSTLDRQTIRDWNNTKFPLERLFEQTEMKERVRTLSPYLRVSDYCIEGTRGFISLSQYYQRILENRGFDCIDTIYEHMLSPDWRGDVLPEA